MLRPSNMAVAANLTLIVYKQALFAAAFQSLLQYLVFSCRHLLPVLVVHCFQGIHSCRNQHFGDLAITCSNGAGIDIFLPKQVFILYFPD